MGMSPRARRMDSWWTWRAVARSNHVIITGERGSGKERIARWYTRSRRARRPFIRVNAARDTTRLGGGCADTTRRLNGRPRTGPAFEAATRGRCCGRGREGLDGCRSSCCGAEGARDPAVGREQERRIDLRSGGDQPDSLRRGGWTFRQDVHRSSVSARAFHARAPRHIFRGPRVLLAMRRCAEAQMRASPRTATSCCDKSGRKLASENAFRRRRVARGSRVELADLPREIRGGAATAASKGAYALERSRKNTLTRWI